MGMINEYDELKTLLKKTRLLKEQAEVNNLGKSIEDNIEDDEVEYDDEIDTEKV